MVLTNLKSDETWFWEAFHHNVYTYKLYRNKKIRIARKIYNIRRFFLGFAENNQQHY